MEQKITWQLAIFDLIWRKYNCREVTGGHRKYVSNFSEVKKNNNNRQKYNQWRNAFESQVLVVIKALLKKQKQKKTPSPWKCQPQHWKKSISWLFLWLRRHPSMIFAPLHVTFQIWLPFELPKIIIKKKTPALYDSHKIRYWGADIHPSPHSTHPIPIVAAACWTSSVFTSWTETSFGS